MGDMCNDYFFVWNMSKIEIKGDNNQIYSGVNNSRINSNDINVSQKSKKEWSTWVAIIIAVLTLIATCIIGWDHIVNFFINIS